MSFGGRLGRNASFGDLGRLFSSARLHSGSWVPSCFSDPFFLTFRGSLEHAQARYESEVPGNTRLALGGSLSL